MIERPSTIHIRRAKPSDFSPRIAELVWSEDPALMRLEFGSLEHWNRVAATEWPETGSGNCYDATALALDDGEVCGLINGFPAHEIEPRFAKSDALRQDSLLNDETANLINGLFVDPDPNAFYILDLAVHASAQKTGLGTALIGFIKDHAVRTNHTSLALDVSETNLAVGFYKHLGFCIVSRSHVPDLDSFGIGAHLHMTYPISQ